MFFKSRAFLVCTLFLLSSAGGLAQGPAAQPEGQLPAAGQTGQPVGGQPLAGTPADNAFQRARDLEQAGEWRSALDAYKHVWDDFHTSNPQRAYEAVQRRVYIFEQKADKPAIEQEYQNVHAQTRNSQSDIASEALFQAGLFARDKLANTASERPDAYAKAWAHWRALEKEFPNTAAGRKVTQEGLLKKLEDDLNRMYASDWKYQTIDMLVGLTGRNPNFSYALALILIAVIVKVLTLPLTRKQYKSMHEMRRIQPLLKELQEKYKGNPEFPKKQMELFKEHGVSPFAGCFPALVQLPFLILVFNAIRTYEVAFTRGKFLWIGSPLAEQYPKVFGSNLSMSDVPLLTMYVITNYITMRMTPASDPAMEQQQKTMALMMSLMFFWMFLTNQWSSAFILYWLALNVLSIWQQYELVYKVTKKDGPGGAQPAFVAATVAPTAPTPEPNELRARPRKKK